MNFEDIFEAWEKDTDIDTTELGAESLKTAKLHHKYYVIYAQEKLKLKKLESEMKHLKFQKAEFYLQGPSEETKENGWKFPSRGMILKSDLPMYMDGDNDLIALSLKIGVQQEKIELLESIIKMIINRSYIIKNCIEFEKFRQGG